MSWQCQSSFRLTRLWTPRMHCWTGLGAVLSAVLVSGCGISVPGTAGAESTETSSDSNLGMTDPTMMPGMPGTAPAATPGMHGATPGAAPGMHGGTPGAAPGMHGGAPGAAPGMHDPAMAAAANPGVDPAMAPTPGAAGHAPMPGVAGQPTTPMPGVGHAANPGVDPAAMAAAAAAGGHGAANPMPGANPGFIPMPGVDPAANAGVAPAAAAAAAAALQAQAGAPGAPGAPGALPGAGQGAQGGRSNQYEAGTPDRVVMDFADAIEAGDIEAAGKLISARARGTLATVREGTISENQLAQLKAYTATLERVGGRNSGSSNQNSYNGGADKVLQFKVAKGTVGFEITEMDVRDKPRRAGR